jgi:hypothetical protein
MAGVSAAGEYEGAAPAHLRYVPQGPLHTAHDAQNTTETGMAAFSCIRTAEYTLRSCPTWAAIARCPVQSSSTACRKGHAPPTGTVLLNAVHD